MIKISNVSKTFKKRKSKTVAVDHVNLQINKKEIICILGHNGAGKTTLIKCISGLIVPSTGDITINDKSVVKNPDVAKQSVGAVLEGSRNIYYYLTAKENLKYFGLLNNLPIDVIEQRTEYYLDLFDLKGRENEMVKQFSRGMQQKVAIMVSLMKDPDVLLLDEPTLGLDIVSSNIVKNVIKHLAEEWNKTIIITTHDVSLIENLNSRVIFMKNGRVIKDNKLSNIKELIGKNNDYEVVIENNGELTVPESEHNFKVVSREEQIIKINTNSTEWLAEALTKYKVLNIKKVESEFHDIYKKIVETGEIDE